MQGVLSAVFSPDFVYSILRLTTPILFASLAAVVTDRAGVMNIGLEGIMLCSALAGVIGSAYSQNAFVGLLFSVVTGALIGLLMSYCALNLKTDIILTGIAVNLFASGGTVFVLFAVCGEKGMSMSLASLTMPIVHLPLIKDIPILGPMISGHNLLTYLAFILVAVVSILLYKTPLGLRIRVVGENSHAAESVGINVRRIQYSALILSGILASLGGAYMSMGYMDKFARDMTAGRGFIALAAEALGHGSPLGAMLASLVFGSADALASNLQMFNIPVQFIQMMPYVITILGLVIYSALRSKKTEL